MEGRRQEFSNYVFTLLLSSIYILNHCSAIITRNNCITSKAMHYRQDNMLLHDSGVNYNVNNNYTKYLA